MRYETNKSSTEVTIVSDDFVVVGSFVRICYADIRVGTGS